MLKNAYSPLQRQLLLLLCLPLIPAIGMGLFHKKAPPWSKDTLGEGEVDSATVANWANEPLWVDARSEAAFESAHIPGAVLLNEDSWESLLPHFLEILPLEPTHIVVYCSSRQCNASKAIAERLRNELGLESVYILKGGWEAWKDYQDY